jgi:polysaccharide export outer membrane protein
VVLVDGSLNLPVIGSITVRGLTLQQATDVISSQYARFVRRPLITISLLTPRPVVIAVAGEVQRPGTYSVAVAGGAGGGAPGGPAGGQFPTVTQAITLAGGITQSAAVRDVQIRRRTSPTTEQVYNVNLWELLQGNLAQDVALRDGDSIFIPAVGSYNAAETRQLADASFAPQQIEPVNIAIIGEVARPGPYSVSGGGVGTGGATGAITGDETGAVGAGGGDAGPPTVTKAIQVAGGITSLADIRSITITRATRTGGTRVIPINLWELLRAGDLTEDFLLQEGDTITIPTATALDPAEASQLAEASFAPNTIVVNVVGEVEAPGAITVPPNTPLNQAVLAAGGFNPRARRSSVDLIRLNDNGTVSKRRISVDLAQGINEEGNPTLRNNDVVVIRRNTLASVGDTLGNALNPVGSFFNILGIFRTLTGD